MRVIVYSSVLAEGPPFLKLRSLLYNMAYTRHNIRFWTV